MYVPVFFTILSNFKNNKMNNEYTLKEQKEICSSNESHKKQPDLCTDM